MITSIKKLLKDLSLLFVNFPHWVVSKFIISVFSYMVGIVLSLPFFVVMSILIYFSPVNWGLILSVFLNSSMSIDYNTITSLLENIFSSILIIVLLLLGIFILVAGISYGRVLLFNLNLSYIKGKRLGYMKNKYFDIGFIFKYLKILGQSFLILLSPVMVFVLGMVILVLIFGKSTSIAVYSPFNILSFILAVFCILAFFYLIFRLLFSYIILCDKETKQKANYYLKKSFKLTKGWKNLFKFIILLLLLGVILLPFNIVSSLISDKQKRVSDYVYHINDEVKISNSNYLSELALEYSKKTEEELRSELRNTNIMSLFYFIFSFFVIYGLYQMLFVSFYVGELKSKKHIISIKE